MSIIKNNHNYTIQIIHGTNLHSFLLVLDFSVFTPNNLFTTKIKNLNEHVMENWTSIEI